MEAYTLNDIYTFLRQTIPLKEAQPLTADSDIQKEFGVDGDDFEYLLEQYAEAFNVHFEGFLWYFHYNDEGSIVSLSRLIFKPASKQVDRIPVTPQLLLVCANEGKWAITYPRHTPPKRNNFAWFLELVMYVICVFLFAAVLAGIIRFF